jgi:rhodanese-related sulfurtransferase
MTHVPNISADQLKTLLQQQSCLLVDVREPEEFASFHLPGSISIPLSRLTQCGLAVPGGTTAVVTICARGYRSAEAAKQLILAGIPHVQSLEGGLQAWQASAQPQSACKASAGFDRPRSILFGLIHVGCAGLALAWDPSWALGNLALGLGMVLNGLMGWCGLSLWFNKPSS